jgi:hypothetical protein
MATHHCASQWRMRFIACMPEFTAPITDDSDVFAEVYALSILAPWLDPSTVPPSMTAYIVPEVAGCFISEELAKQYDPTIKEGERLILNVVERKSGVIHQYPLAVPIRFAKTSRPDYVQISLDYIESMFDVAIYYPKQHESPEAQRLDLRLRVCVAYPFEPPDEDEGILAQ